MKASVLILVFVLCNTMITKAQNCSISGHVMYKNAVNTLMKDSTTVYMLQNNVIKYSCTTDTNGYYQIDSILPGTYLIKSGCTKKWGGGNATDALFILRHFVGMLPQLYGLNLIVADVNQSGGTPASVDALAVSRRFVGYINSFAPAPDWYSTKYTINFTNQDILIQDIYMLCGGDVNGSFIPE